MKFSTLEVLVFDEISIFSLLKASSFISYDTVKPGVATYVLLGGWHLCMFSSSEKSNWHMICSLSSNSAYEDGFVKVPMKIVFSFVKPEDQCVKFM